MSSEKNKSATDIGGQLALDLPVAHFVAREDLVRGAANSIAVDMIDSWPDWPGNVVVLAGPVGSGKSHLAGVWAQKSNAKILTMGQLNTLEDDRQNNRPLLLEDAISGHIDETQLFHVLNIKRATGSSVVITSRTWPTDWGIDLPDLNSRLRAAQLVELGEPDDPLLRGVLFKLFADRQLPVDPSVIDFLVVRMERSLEAANKIVAHLDNTGLAQNRKITRKLAGEVLSVLENRGPLDD